MERRSAEGASVSELIAAAEARGGESETCEGRELVLPKTQVAMSRREMWESGRKDRAQVAARRGETRARRWDDAATLKAIKRRQRKAERCQPCHPGQHRVRGGYLCD